MVVVFARSYACGRHICVVGAERSGVGGEWSWWKVELVGSRAGKK